MRIGLFGFPGTGKSTLFRLMTGVEPPARVARGEVTVGIARVADPRLETLRDLYRPKKFTPATVEYIDIGGVEKGEAAEALPLEAMRTADALAHVVRGFCDDSIPHVEGDPDPARDVATMETELILADHTLAERRIEKLESLVRKTGREEEKRELDLLGRCLAALEAETPLRDLDLSAEDAKRLRGFTFLSRKPLLVVVNADESDAARLDAGASAFGLEALESRPSTAVVALSAKIESEIAQLGPEDAAAFRDELGIAEPALDRTIRASYRLLGRISFFTVGEDECRAWTIRAGLPARAAAGTIHSDLERGFIRAEVAPYEALREAGSMSACRERGTLRLEGKDYIVRDGDVMNVRFAV